MTSFEKVDIISKSSDSGSKRSSSLQNCDLKDYGVSAKIKAKLRNRLAKENQKLAQLVESGG